MRSTLIILAAACTAVSGILFCPLLAQISVVTPNPAIVSITVGRPLAAVVKVPDTIFGSFLEPIGNSINHGLSAEILSNPSLESGLWSQANLKKLFAQQPSLERVSGQFGLPVPWQPLDPKAGRRFEIHAGDGANTWQSVEIMGVPGHGVGLMQQVYLPTHRVLTYDASFYARHLEGSPTITVLLLASDSGKVLAKRMVAATGSAWTKYTARLSVKSGQVQPLQPVRFAIQVAPDERVDVDEFSLMPTDAVDGFDPDVVTLARTMGLTELRLSGNFSSNYHWRDGIGPLVQRKTMENIAWGIPEYNKFGTDEFLAFCKMIHAIPQIGLNLGSGTPQEAADWVRYIRRHYDGPVIYELGNELYGKWQVGWVPTDQIARQTREFSAAVRAVESKAPLIATGGMPQDFMTWNAQQLTNQPGTFEYLSTHLIRQTNHDALPNATPDFLAAAAYGLSYYVGRNFQQMQAQVNAAPGYQDGKVHLAMTEWLFSSRGKGERVFTNESPTSTNEGGALMVASIFNTLIRTSPKGKLLDLIVMRYTDDCWVIFPGN